MDRPMEMVTFVDVVIGCLNRASAEIGEQLDVTHVGHMGAWGDAIESTDGLKARLFDFPWFFCKDCSRSEFMSSRKSQIHGQAGQ